MLFSLLSALLAFAFRLVQLSTLSSVSQNASQRLAGWLAGWLQKPPRPTTPPFELQVTLNHEFTPRARVGEWPNTSSCFPTVLPRQASASACCCSSSWAEPENVAAWTKAAAAAAVVVNVHPSPACFFFKNKEQSWKHDLALGVERERKRELCFQVDHHSIIPSSHIDQARQRYRPLGGLSHSRHEQAHRCSCCIVFAARRSCRYLSRSTHFEWPVCTAILLGPIPSRFVPRRGQRIHRQHPIQPSQSLSQRRQSS